MPQWHSSIIALLVRPLKVKNRHPPNDTLSGTELGLKLLQSVKEMQAGQAARITEVELNEVADASKHPEVLLESIR